MPGRSLGVRRKTRRRAIAATTLITFLALLLLYNRNVPTGSSNKSVLQDSQNHDGSTTTLPSVAGQQHQKEEQLLQQRSKLWRSLFEAILKNDPACKQFPEKIVKAPLDIAYQYTLKPGQVHPKRPDLLLIQDDDLERLTKSHTNFVNTITNPNPKHHEDLKLIYTKSTRGVVMTVSDTQIPILLISIRMLRQTQSLLPLEVFLYQSTPYTEHICTTILSTLNSQCVYLKPIFDQASTGVPIDSSYQYKIFAILFSSFDELLFLDSDNFPTTNPDLLFDSSEFISSGLLLWPDFWYPSESPYFFKIAGISPQKIPSLSQDPATEAGQMMYSKTKHHRSIMLAMYYNYFGPGYYYLLQSQGAPGQGDKESFKMAALALDEDFSVVKEGVIALGRQDSSGEFWGSAMVQHDPRFVSGGGEGKGGSIVDQAKSFASSDEKQGMDSDLEGYGDDGSQPRPMFIHLNFPKLDPRTIFTETMIDGAHTPVRDTNGTLVPIWDMSSRVSESRFGVDIEKRLWDVVREVACEDLLGGAGSRSPEAGGSGKNKKEQETCKSVKDYIQKVFGNL